MFGIILKVSILYRSCLGFLVIGRFSPFTKAVRKIVKTRTRRRYTLVRLVRSGPNFSLFPPRALRSHVRERWERRQKVTLDITNHHNV